MKYQVEVTNLYVETHVVEADDIEHAREIGLEISDEMEADTNTYHSSGIDVQEAAEGESVTYVPVQEHLK